MIAAVASLSTGDLIRAVAPSLATDLACPASMRRLTAAGDRLPLISGGGFECHLGNPGRVDLAVRFLPGEDGTEALILETNSDQMVDAGVRRLTREWLRPSSDAEDVPLSLWLEYDLESDELPRSSVFLGPGNPPHAPSPRLNLEMCSRLVQALIPSRQCADLTSAFCELYRALPANAWIGYVGNMANATANRLRVTISGVFPAQITPLLQAIGWRGADMTVAAETAGIPGARVTLSIDLGHDSDPRLGLELALAPDAGWDGMLARVLPMGNCAARLIPALLAWPGVTCCGDDHWPASLRPAVWGITRRLNHLKVVWRGSEPPQVKAYLYFGIVEKT